MSYIGDTGAVLGSKQGAIDGVFYENSNKVVVDYTISAGKNAMTAGPVTINDGVTVTVPDGATWTVV